MDEDQETTHLVHAKIDEILTHGDPAMREMIRDLIFEFHHQVMNDPKSRASMKERMKSLRDNIVHLPLVFKPQKSQPATQKKASVNRWGLYIPMAIALLVMFIVPWSKIKPFGNQKAPTRVCDVKGNITNLGERIYHLPDSKWYDKTYIDESRDERWFCSEDEARGAGWRKALQ